MFVFLGSSFKHFVLYYLVLCNIFCVIFSIMQKKIGMIAWIVFLSVCVLESATQLLCECRIRGGLLNLGLIHTFNLRTWNKVMRLCQVSTRRGKLSPWTLQSTRHLDQEDRREMLKRWTCFCLFGWCAKTPLLSNDCAHFEYCAETHAGASATAVCCLSSGGCGQNCAPRGTEVPWLCVGGKGLS